MIAQRGRDNVRSQPGGRGFTEETTFELREDDGLELREDGGIEERE